MRARFCYGFFESSPFAPPHFADHSERVRDFERVAATYFGGASRLTLGVALNELGLVPFSHTRTEIEVARAHNALIATHMACVWQMPSGFDEIADAGLLGPDMVHIHCNTLSDEQWRRLADAGCKCRSRSRPGPTWAWAGRSFRSAPSSAWSRRCPAT
ncbi:hypothetical protein AB0K60_19980 [Thermopolyspora sp. NPDC052614]|uniref:hypothetical protein n=1 Tax=Thermopolyspora sp. NPDC052614 TaxID=3155682 RepID=UPI003416002A